MMEFILNKLRFFFGNVFGYILHVLIGKKILLREIDETKILSIYFHNPSVNVFETIIKWLVKYNFTIIPIEKVQKFFDEGRCKTVNSVFISFDDAWSNNLKLIPILQKYNIPITLFVPVQAIEDGDTWLNIVRNQFSNIEKELREGISVSDLKKIPYSKGLELYNSAKKTSEVERKVMTKQQLLEFSKHISIGSHSVTHPILTNCSSQIVKFELDKSKAILNEWGLNINKSLAYPNGDFNQETIELLKESEYHYAFTTEPKFIDLFLNQDKYSIPRICIPDNLGRFENLARMSTVWSKIFKN